MKRSALDHDLSTITFDLRRLGSMVEQQTERAIFALQRHDVAYARKIVAWDGQVNALRYKVEHQGMLTIATQQPTARDLRRIVAALHMAIELERMADHAAGIANLTLRVGDAPDLAPPLDLGRMQAHVCEMVRLALLAFTERDAALARSTAALDEEVDALYLQVLRVMLTYMMQDSRLVAHAIYFQWVAHNLERIGDRATNLCERVLFAEGAGLRDLPDNDSGRGEDDMPVASVGSP